MYKTKVLPRAQEEMYELASYIAEEFFNEEAALNLIIKFEKAVDNLKLFPHAHMVFKVIKGFEIRRVVIENCSMFYIVDKELGLVTIINVKHNRSDFDFDI